MIAEALQALAAIQQGLAITSPINARTAKAYAFLPPPEFELPTLTWQNEFALTAMSRQHVVYSVRMQFLAGSALGDTQQTQAVATAFWEALLAVLYPSVSLASLTAAQNLGGCLSHLVRGGNPTVGILQRNGKALVGAEGYLDLTFNFGLAADP